MDVKITLNGKVVTDSVDADMVLLDFCRKHRCYSVKRGCESGNCGLCTVLLDGKPVLSCSTLAARIEGKKIVTLEGMSIHWKDYRKKRKPLRVSLLLREQISVDSAIPDTL